LSFIDTWFLEMQIILIILLFVFVFTQLEGYIIEKTVRKFNLESNSNVRIFTFKDLSILIFSIIKIKKIALLVFKINPQIPEKLTYTSNIKGYLVGKINYTIENLTKIGARITFLIDRDDFGIQKYILVKMTGYNEVKLVKKILYAANLLDEQFRIMGVSLIRLSGKQFEFLLKKISELGIIYLFKTKIKAKYRMFKESLSDKEEIINISERSIPKNTSIFLSVLGLKASNLRKSFDERIITLEFNLFMSVRKISKKILSYNNFKPLLDGIFPYFFLSQDFEIDRKRKSIEKILTPLSIIAKSKKTIYISVSTKSSQMDRLLRGIFSLFINISSNKIPIPEIKANEEYTEGDFWIGWQLIDREPISKFYLSYGDLKRHMAIIGPSGKGKSHLAKLLIDELVKKNKNRIWIFDFHGEYVNLYEKGFKIIVPGSTEAPLALNIFEPYMESTDSYSDFLSNLLTEVFRSENTDLTPQMERLLQMAIHTTIDSPKRNAIQFITNTWKQAELMSMEISSVLATFHAIMNRIKGLFSGIAKDVFWVKKSNVDISKMINENIVFDMSYLLKRGAMKRDLAIIVNVLLRYVINELLKERNYSFLADDFRLFILIEEGRYIIPWRKIESSLDTTAIEDFTVLSRKYGISLCTVSQSPRTISKDVLENVGTLFLMGGELPESYDISDENIKKYLKIMPPQEAIVWLSRSPSVLHIKIRDYKFGLLNFDEYRKILSREGSSLRAKYIPIAINFEELLNRILEKQSSDLIELEENNENSECFQKYPYLNIALEEIIKIAEKNKENLWLLIRTKPNLILHTIEETLNKHEENVNIDQIIGLLSCLLRKIESPNDKNNYKEKFNEMEILDLVTNYVRILKEEQKQLT